MPTVTTLWNPAICPRSVQSSWNVMAHGDARMGKWRGNWRMEWVGSTLHTTRNMVYPALLPLMSTPRLPVVDWSDAPAGLNGLVRFSERRNLVSARVSSHFKRGLSHSILISMATSTTKDRLVFVIQILSIYCAERPHFLTHWGRVTQICVFTLQLCKTDDANLRF